MVCERRVLLRVQHLWRTASETHSGLYDEDEKEVEEVEGKDEVCAWRWVH